MAKITLSDGTILEGTVKELTQYAEMATKLTKKIGSEQESPTDELITHNGAEYTLVDRKAQPGDVVVFTESTMHYVKNGKLYGPVDDEGEFLDEVGDYIYVYWKSSGRDIHNVKVYEPVAQPLKVGDYAKVIKADKFSIGDIVYISKEDSVHFHCEKVTSGYWHFADKEGELVRATDEEVAEAKAQAEKATLEAKWAKIGRKPNEFKKGDIVRYKSDGEICEVLLVTDSGKVKVETLNSGPCYEDKDIELFTPVESRFDRA